MNPYDRQWHVALDDNPQGRASTSHGHTAAGPFQYPSEPTEVSASAPPADPPDPPDPPNADDSQAPPADPPDPPDPPDTTVTPALAPADTAPDNAPKSATNKDLHEHSLGACPTAAAVLPLMDPSAEASETLCLLATEDLIPLDWDCDPTDPPAQEAPTQPPVILDPADLLAATPQQQPFSNDVWTPSDIFVDNFLVFPNTDLLAKADTDKEEIPQSANAFVADNTATTPSANPSNASSDLPIPVATNFWEELSIPTADLEHLEWLSSFLEDSFSQLPFPADLAPAPSSLATSSSPTDGPLSLPTTHNQDFLFCNNRPRRKKRKKKPLVVSNTLHPHRSCTHCMTRNTPQWRAGPLGPHTLCNACGVRYNSGRLLPEYRPAKSPSFSCTAHSNWHRQVLELRRHT